MRLVQMSSPCAVILQCILGTCIILNLLPPVQKGPLMMPSYSGHHLGLLHHSQFLLPV